MIREHAENVLLFLFIKKFINLLKKQKICFFFKTRYNMKEIKLEVGK